MIRNLIDLLPLNEGTICDCNVSPLILSWSACLPFVKSFFEGLVNGSSLPTLKASGFGMNVSLLIVWHKIKIHSSVFHPFLPLPLNDDPDNFRGMCALERGDRQRYLAMAGRDAGENGSLLVSRLLNNRTWTKCGASRMDKYAFRNVFAEQDRWKASYRCTVQIS